jgi:hypothetical protein
MMGERPDDDPSKVQAAWSDERDGRAAAWFGWAAIAAATMAVPIILLLVVLKVALGVRPELLLPALASGNGPAVLRSIFDAGGAAMGHALQAFGPFAPLALIVIPLLIMLRLVRAA